MKKTLLLIFIFTFYKISFACDCRSRSIDVAYENSEIVIHGFVISESIHFLEQSTEYLDSLSNVLRAIQFGPNRVKEYKILVLTNYKNNVLIDTILVRTNASCSCQITLDTGKEYILFAYEINYMDRLYDINTDKFTFQTWQCSNTIIFDKRISQKLTKLKETAVYRRPKESLQINK